MPVIGQSIRVQVITLQFWMMLLKVGFSFYKLFWVLEERNREKQDYHYLHTLFKIKLAVTEIQNIPFDA